MRSQAARLSGHPSVAAFLIGSDKAPPDDVASAYIDALKSVDWPNPVLPAASHEGDSGLKMPGPYDWVPPNYWLEDKKNGGAFGFNSETGPGAAIPELESLKMFLSPRELDDLWTKPNAPVFHAGAPGHKFETLAIFQRAMRARLGGFRGLEDWVRKAQLMSYEAERAELEAYGVRKYAGTTGIVHWLYNSPWPSLIWNLSNWTLLPAAGFYGAKKANEPVHAVYAYDDRGVIVVNHTQKAEPALSVAVRVLDVDGNERAVERLPVSVGADAFARVGQVADVPGLKGPRFIELELRRGPDVVSTNTYWLAERPDVLGTTGTTFVHTPTARYADLTRLAKLAPATIKVGTTLAKADGRAQVTVTLENTGKGVALFLRLTLRRGAEGTAVTPVFWDDNYVTLRPGAKRTLVVACPEVALDGRAPAIEVEGMNVARIVTP
jgi:exo-1,4-beta-D-glucosaminidase